MTVMLYPTKTSPKGYRVQDKVLNVQKYFPFSKFGTPKKAEKSAREFQEQLSEKRKVREIRLTLDVNQIFHADGSVKGLSKRLRRTNNGSVVEVLRAQVSVDGKQVSTDWQLKNRTFREAYKGVQDWILEKRGITRTREITNLFKEVEGMYK
ncbi:hypothetical protein CW749_14390 [Vibrio sp. vnigr-6D03]|uniref:Uncharacterized protein n=1 Tax=Vibrio penaeicida TaxID=104609 RepID=A0AAV5NK35_9VIBR|nr:MULTISPECIES: hypothetical protein [Vibrio]PKF78899.1 hypothetical protein CW749_14390 [Vibrio sp. vnigr-6D03]RTZ22023.1 hypothetical protein EKN09_16315 [Vibrio penaeicida]GLQ70865.1 hypothetical protein GCM10007932_02250 [Vibrio penaeicida]